MSDNIKLSFSDVETICRFNAELIQAAENALARLRQIPPSQRDLMLSQNLVYWQNVRSALRWSSGQAKQRLKGSKHAGC